VKDPGDRAAYVNKLYDQSLTLELLTWLGDMTTLPIVVKGILRGDSAELAARHPNVRGIVVSNHGGRQLDNCIAPLTALPEIVRVVDKVEQEYCIVRSECRCTVLLECELTCLRACPPARPPAHPPS
jgi:isopentenyl diphosphate isomerase/L-lactate dehydrogenase-like FMN-dependent dehydrogenase